MRHVSSFALLGLLAACSGNTTNPTDTVVTEPEPLAFDFKTTIPATEFTASVSPTTLEAHQISNMLFASMGVLSSDEKVQDLYNANGGGKYRSVLQCWQRPQFPRWSFDIQFDTCDSFQMDGAVNVNNHPSGILLFNFSNFRISGREMGGTLAFDTTGAFPDSLYWNTYNTTPENPGQADDSRVPIGVTIDGIRKGITYDGGANVSFLNQELSMWGTATIEGEDDTITFVHGSADENEVAPDDPPGASALRKSLNWLDCRCPTSGVSAVDMPLEVTEVLVDIDDMEVDPDEVDDIAIDIPVTHTIEGRAVLDHTGCGEYGVTYTSDATSMSIDRNLLLGRLTFLCDTNTIDDDERCAALFRAATRLPEQFEVEITQMDLNQTARNAVDNDFDVGWCRIQ
ncbi:MAG: hypothetical protein KTR31_31735 [Myxococcales bacterium]|nr:hypothetical protein [Myxococcales bacterium]